LRYLSPKRFKGVKGCNFASWKTDLVRVNGFDESYVGWGYEDTDLLLRLFNAGVRRKSGKFSVPILHLWHPQNDRGSERKNFDRMKSIQNSGKIRADQGLQECCPPHATFRAESRRK
jgi:GT2 family glycosyltransferase